MRPDVSRALGVGSLGGGFADALTSAASENIVELSFEAAGAHIPKGFPLVMGNSGSGLVGSSYGDGA
jgi:hypothetical protein